MDRYYPYKTTHAWIDRYIHGRSCSFQSPDTLDCCVVRACGVSILSTIVLRIEESVEMTLELV